MEVKPQQRGAKCGCALDTSLNLSFCFPSSAPHAGITQGNEKGNAVVYDSAVDCQDCTHSNCKMQYYNINPHDIQSLSVRAINRSRIWHIRTECTFKVKGCTDA